MSAINPMAMPARLSAGKKKPGVQDRAVSFEKETMNVIVPGSQVLTMTSREIAELTGKEHAHVMRDVRALVDALAMNPDLDSCVKSTTYTGKDGREYPQYTLDKDACLTLLLGYDTVARMKVVKRWQELETRSTIAVPNFSNPAEAARAWALAYEAQQAAEEAARIAIATKAQIGSRREATAMAAASAAKREAARLKDALGFSTRHATILQVEHAIGSDFDFVPLRRWCKANEVAPETVPDKRYPKGVKAWPAGAWLDVYGVDIAALFVPGVA